MGLRIFSLTLKLFLALISLTGCAGGNALPQGSQEDFKTYQSLGHYKAFAVTRTKGSSFARAWGWTSNALSVTDAMNRALSSCKEGSAKYSRATECSIHSVGDITVHGMSEDELEYVINQYANDFDITLDDIDLTKVNQ